MGLIREPEGVDFVIAGGPLSPKDAKMISAWIKKQRAERDRITAKVARLEAQLRALPVGERKQLVHRLIDSLTTEELLATPGSESLKPVSRARPQQRPSAPKRTATAGAH